MTPDSDKNNDQTPPATPKPDRPKKSEKIEGPERPTKLPKLPGVGQQPSGKFGRSILGWILIIVLFLLLVQMLRTTMDSNNEIDINEFMNHVRNGHVVGKIKISRQEIRGTLSKLAEADKDKRNFFVEYPIDLDDSFLKRLTQELDNQGNKATISYEHPSWFETVLPHLIVPIIIFAVIWFVLFRKMGAGGGGAGLLGNFGRSRHRITSREQSDVTFNDVAGIDEAKEELAEIVEFLRNAKKFQRLGGRIPRGVLLVGQPGCGKTLLAKAIAGEADVPFFSISGSDFVEMFVGVGASRVRDLFKQAKDSSPCIIFLDEVDAVGRRRGASFGGGGGHDEREQTLNAILVEMDGFESSDQVIVIAATNRLDVLDPALTRPGRFDRQITVPLPDLHGRYEILKIYADKVTCNEDVDLHKIARGTPMFSGADLAALVNEAAIAATMAGKDSVETADMEEARDKVRWGRARKSGRFDDKEKEITAYHEAGHALVQELDKDADPLHKVSIIPRGEFGGATFALPEKDRHLYTRNYCHAMLRVCFGGRIAEDLFCGDISSGASADIGTATGIARTMVVDWGMSDKLGMIRYSGEPNQMFAPMIKDHSDTTAELIDTEIKAIVDKAYAETTELIQTNRDALERIAQALLKYETLGAEEIQQIIDGKTLDKPTVADLLEHEKTKSKEDIPPQSPEAEEQNDGDS